MASNGALYGIIGALGVVVVGGGLYIAKQEGAIASLKIVNRQMDFIEALVDVDVRDVSHLSKVIAGLRGAVGIKGVERG